VRRAVALAATCAALAGAACGKDAPRGPVVDPVDVMIAGDSTRLRLEDPLPATSPFFDGTRVRVTAARGEVIGLQVMYRGERAVTASLGASAAVPPGGGTPASSDGGSGSAVAGAITRWAIEPVLVVRPSTSLWGGSRGAGKYPDRLRRLDGAAPTAGPVLVEIAVPADAPVGLLEGTIAVGERSFPLAITVAPVTLPSLADAPRVWAYYDPRELATIPGVVDARAAERACAQMLRAHGVMATPELTLENYAERADAVAGARYIPVLLPRDFVDVEGTVRGWTQLLAGTGRVPFAIPIDEPRDDAARTRVKELAARVRAAGGGPDRFLYAVTDVPRDIYGDVVDLYISPFAMKLAGSSRETWTYNGTPPWAGAMTVDAGGVDLRTWGWIGWRWRVPVWYVWESHYWHDRHNRKRHKLAPIEGPPNTGAVDAVTFDDDEDHGNLDGVLVLPPVPGDEAAGCAPTLRLATLRRGLQDRALLDALEACGGRARAEAIAKTLVPVALGDAKKGDRAAWPSDEAAYEAARVRLLGELAGCAM
jgi:hypothetical protein